ncbi:hypothetical protein [Neobacillus fumarioli]|uniref:hypothetical protein n=1 Tax=Neobacillus fumarioli TaxID=105229 RepID=UPI0014701190|nr:hypothetical protein [Neobacillus fumarioli]
MKHESGDLSDLFVSFTFFGDGEDETMAPKGFLLQLSFRPLLTFERIFYFGEEKKNDDTIRIG